jgi:hypothetical protein
VAEQAYAYVTLIPVAKGFQQAVAKELGGVNNVGEKAGDDAGKGFGGGFGKALRGIGGLVATGLAAAGIGNFFRDSVSGASDLNESLNAVSVAYGDATGGIIALGETAANRLGLSQNAFNSIATQFSGFAANIAGEGGDVVGFIDELSTRGADFASVFNLDVNEALGLFQSGLAGETEPLRRFGIDLSAATVEAFAYANGIGEVGKPLTEAEKQQARYGALLEQTNIVQGDFANTSDSLANAQRILGANFENVQATVGGPLLNAFANLTTGLLPVIEQMGPILTSTIEQLAPVIEDLVGQIPGILEGFLPLIPVLGDLAALFLSMVAELLPVFVDLFMAFLPTITELLPIVVSFVNDAMAVLVPILMELLEALMPIVEALLPVFLDIFTALAPVALELIQAMLPIIERILPLFIGFIEFLTPILVTIADIMGVVLVGAVDLFVGAIEWVSEKVGEFGEFFEDTWDGIKDFFEPIINGMISGFEGFVNGAIKGINRLIRGINDLQWTVPDWVPIIGGSKFGFNIPTIPEISLPRVALAEGGLVTGPTNALVGEAGPEMVIPLDRFESMVNDLGSEKTVNYYAAPNQSLSSEQALFQAMRRARLVAQW